MYAFAQLSEISGNASASVEGVSVDPGVSVPVAGVSVSVSVLGVSSSQVCASGLIIIHPPHPHPPQVEPPHVAGGVGIGSHSASPAGPYPYQYP